MENTIKRNSILVELMALTNNSAFGGGEVVSCHKDPEDGHWITTDSNGKKYQSFISHMRNENYYKLINQYSLEDIRYYLYDKYPDMQTVIWEMLRDAIYTALKETGYAMTIDSICKYIATELI